MSKKFKDFFTERTMSYTIAICSGVVLFMAISKLPTLKLVWDKLISVMSPFIYAFAIAYILNKPAMWFEKKFFYKFKKRKTLSILVTYVIFLTAVTSLILAVIPQLVLSLSYIVEASPAFFEKVTNFANSILNDFHWNRQLIRQLNDMWNNLVSSITQFSIAVLPEVLNFSFSLGNGIVKLLMVLIISIYMISGKSRLLFQFKKATYAIFPIKKADTLVKIANRSNRIFVGFIMGKLIDSIIIGILAFIGMLFIYPPYAILIAVVIGVTNMIPFFGPFIGAIPCIFILVIVSPATAFIFTLFIIALQQFDGNILGPKILGDSLGLSPIWVLVAILVGNGLFGLIGMLIGVPSFAVLYTICSDIIKNKLNEKGIEANYETNTIEFNEIGQNDNAI